MWDEATIARCLALWRKDLKAMDLGAYVAPLPDPIITDLRPIAIPKPPRPLREFVHNRSGYCRGCRCDVCRDANRVYMREYYQRCRAQ